MEQFEREFAEIDQKLNRLATDRGVYANGDENRNTSLFGRLSQSNSNSGELILYRFRRIYHIRQTSCLHTTHNLIRMVFQQALILQEPKSLVAREVTPQGKMLQLVRV